jgi:hypothetical protein
VTTSRELVVRTAGAFLKPQRGGDLPGTSRFRDERPATLSTVTNPEDAAISKRAEDLAHAAGFVDVFQELADEVEGLWAAGVAEREIDRHVLARIREMGWDPREHFATFPEVAHLTDDQREQILKALRIEDWGVECVKSIARTGKPLPFIYAVGDVFVDTSAIGDGTTLVWAVATSATNPEDVAKKFVRKCKEVFGDQVTKEQRPQIQRPGQYTPAEAHEKHRQGMSYRDLAVQNLRRTYPDIIAHPHRYRRETRTERERLVDEIARFAELWGKRIPDSPTEE